MTNKEAIKILRKGYPDIKRYATIELGAYEYDVKAYNEALNLAIKALEERPQGEWIKWNFKTFGAMGDWEYKCSRCEKVYGGEYNFCPNCGADMQKGNKE